MRKELLLVYLLGVATTPVFACAISQEKAVIESAADASTKQRHDAFEATARMLDERPEYVDEFYAIARQHTPTFNRFLIDTLRDSDDLGLAWKQADILTSHPAALEAVFTKTLEEAKNKPHARLVIARVVEKKAALVAEIQGDRQATVLATMKATIDVVNRRPALQVPFHEAMQEKAATVADIMAKDPKTLGVLTKQLLRVEVKDDDDRKKLVDKLFPSP